MWKIPSMMLRLALAMGAIGFAGISILGVPALESRQDVFQHSCYAGCCGSCQGGLCCYDWPPFPERLQDDEPL